MSQALLHGTALFAAVLRRRELSRQALFGHHVAAVSAGSVLAVRLLHIVGHMHGLEHALWGSDNEPYALRACMLHLSLSAFHGQSVPVCMDPLGVLCASRSNSNKPASHVRDPARIEKPLVG